MTRSRGDLRMRDPEIFLPLSLLACAHCHGRILRTIAVDYENLFVEESRLSPRAVRTFFLFLSSICSGISSQVNVAIGYAAFPGASVMEIRESWPGVLAATAAAAVTLEILALTNSFEEFLTVPKLSSCWIAKMNSTYPMEFGVCCTVVAIPSLPTAPTPTGHGTVVPTPIEAFHCGLTLDK